MRYWTWPQRAAAVAGAFALVAIGALGALALSDKDSDGLLVTAAPSTSVVVAEVVDSLPPVTTTTTFPPDPREAFFATSTTVGPPPKPQPAAPAPASKPPATSKPAPAAAAGPSCSVTFATSSSTNGTNIAYVTSNQPKTGILAMGYAEYEGQSGPEWGEGTDGVTDPAGKATMKVYAEGGRPGPGDVIVIDIYVPSTRTPGAKPTCSGKYKWGSGY